MTRRNGATIGWTSYNLPDHITHSSGDYADFTYGPDRSRWIQQAEDATCGYYDLTTFTRAFKKCNGGIGPRAYRKLCLSSSNQSRNRAHGEASVDTYGDDDPHRESWRLDCDALTALDCS